MYIVQPASMLLLIPKPVGSVDAIQPNVWPLESSSVFLIVTAGVEFVTFFAGAKTGRARIGALVTFVAVATTELVEFVVVQLVCPAPKLIGIREGGIAPRDIPPSIARIAAISKILIFCIGSLL